ncbi:MAG: ParB/RepB/Spo0J family partition protein [Tenericutes bacterium]|jgi:ParB family chromosome partitioning protein|nr:ParB/RepB/Spo0J family partition protein [Bacilli bacterium]MDD3995892.1 ParB/RepB/Spo0J family partition protein [Bacilli bacterium]MDD4623971.1 ParB/RepB/Spo0J family partition protein [Bacilli bacterium]MDD4831346.1 ParB/RepB/Spo0J family partition protein [Bacilli bacterium]NLV90617.1 ParB/RepB/Spo0J family partition protein [Mycoplasmatota bacterium]
MENKRRALGKGLEELFNSESLEIEKIEERILQEATKDEIVEIRLDELRKNPYQPRKVFDEESLKELSESIKNYGVFQPIIVKKSIRGYEIIAGERRVRASRMAGLETIPSIVRDFSDEQMMQIALLENLQREDLTAIEEANAYKEIIASLQITQDDLAIKIGKSRSHITNILGLLNLPTSVQDMLLKREISMGHARVLSKLQDQSQIELLAKRVVNESLSVRNLESLVDNTYKRKVIIKRESKPIEYKYIEEALKEKLDTSVFVTNNKIQIKYESKEDLNRILEILEIDIK